MTVAALYVDPHRGPYAKMGLECWGMVDATTPGLWDRDATKYEGPHAIVAHPPCGPWGLFAWNYKGGEGAKSCGPRAVEQVRRWGGVLEHPRGSQLWPHCGLPKPGDPPDGYGGWTLAVEQVHWGHPCEKPTWLYIVGTDEVPPMPLNEDGPTHCMVRLRSNPHELPELSKRRRHLTPPAFAWWLRSVAERCQRAEVSDRRST